MKTHNYTECLTKEINNETFDMYRDCDECRQTANDVIDVESMHTGVVSETCKGSKCWCNYE
jgi:hypothetical protein